MLQKLRAPKSGKAEAASDDSVALFIQQTLKGNEKKKMDLTNVTYFGCGIKEHVKAKCKEKTKGRGYPQEGPPGALYMATSAYANRALTDLLESTRERQYTLFRQEANCAPQRIRKAS